MRKRWPGGKKKERKEEGEKRMERGDWRSEEIRAREGKSNREGGAKRRGRRRDTEKEHDSKRRVVGMEVRMEEIRVLSIRGEWTTISIRLGVERRRD